MKNSSRPWQVIAVAITIAGALLLGLSGYVTPLINAAEGPLVSFQAWFALRYITIYEFLTVPRDMASIQQRNVELESEVARLQTEIVQLQQQLKEAQVLYALLNFARARPNNQYIAVAVIGQDPSPFLRYVIVDHGSDDGLRHGMPVVTEQGLVGRIEAVTAKAARVQLISDPGFSANVRLQKSQISALQVGSLTGDVSLEMIPQDANIQPGDLVLTSGLGGSYPADIVIGQVVTVRKSESGLFQSASLQPAVSLSNLRAALVIMNFEAVDTQPLVPTPIP